MVWANPACCLCCPGHASSSRATVHVLGGDMRSRGRTVTAACPRIAYMPQGLGKNLYPTLSVEENLQFFARLFGHDAAERRRAHRRPDPEPPA